MAYKGFSLKEWIEQAEKSENFESYKVYIIEVFNKDEKFIKIGRTFNTVEKRFSMDGSLPYSYNIINIIEDNAYRIFHLETKLKRMCKQYSYQPKLKFKGVKECFTLDALDILKQNNYVNT